LQDLLDTIDPDTVPVEASRQVLDPRLDKMEVGAEIPVEEKGKGRG
jgi:hypothetical protein